MRVYCCFSGTDERGMHQSLLYALSITALLRPCMCATRLGRCSMSSDIHTIRHCALCPPRTRPGQPGAGRRLPLRPHRREPPPSQLSTATFCNNIHLSSLIVDQYLRCLHQHLVSWDYARCTAPLDIPSPGAGCSRWVRLPPHHAMPFLVLSRRGLCGSDRPSDFCSAVAL
jgi:hypothetical protein